MKIHKYCTYCKQTTPHIESTSIGLKAVSLLTLGLGGACNGNDYTCLRCGDKKNEYSY